MCVCVCLRVNQTITLQLLQVVLTRKTPGEYSSSIDLVSSIVKVLSFASLNMAISRANLDIVQQGVTLSIVKSNCVLFSENSR